MSEDFKLQPGVGFHLKPDGNWLAEKIPPEVLQEAKFSGYLTIEGYRSTVFETKNKEQWAQKSTGTSALASRVAARYLLAKKDDVTSQVQEILNDERQDTEYNAAIVDFCDKAFSELEVLNDAVETCVQAFANAATKLQEHEHEKVQNTFALKMHEALKSAAMQVKNAGDGVITEVATDLKSLKDGATRV